MHKFLGEGVRFSLGERHTHRKAHRGVRRRSICMCSVGRPRAKGPWLAERGGGAWPAGRCPLHLPQPHTRVPFACVWVKVYPPTTTAARTKDGRLTCTNPPFCFFFVSFLSFFLQWKYGETFRNEKSRGSFANRRSVAFFLFSFERRKCVSGVLSRRRLVFFLKFSQLRRPWKFRDVPTFRREFFARISPARF